MRERQVDHPAAIGAPSSHGLGWWLDRGGIVEHGGGTPGVVARLRISPQHGLAAAVLTNGESGSALMDELLAPWFDDLPGLTPTTTVPTPAVQPRSFDPSPYLGRYECRQHRFEVGADRDRRLWLSDTPQGDSLEMAERAGILLTTQTHELRPLTGDTFIIMDEAGVGIGAVEFLGRDPPERARFLYYGERAAPRHSLISLPGGAPRPPSRPGPSLPR